MSSTTIRPQTGVVDTETSFTRGDLPVNLWLSDPAERSVTGSLGRMGLQVTSARATNLRQKQRKGEEGGERVGEVREGAGLEVRSLAEVVGLARTRPL